MPVIIEEFKDGDWWWKEIDREIWHRFEKKDYINKINQLFVMISEIGTENDVLIEKNKAMEQENKSLKALTQGFLYDR